MGNLILICCFHLSCANLQLLNTVEINWMISLFVPAFSYPVSRLAFSCFHCVKIIIIL